MMITLAQLVRRMSMRGRRVESTLSCRRFVEYAGNECFAKETRGLVGCLAMGTWHPVIGRPRANICSCDFEQEAAAAAAGASRDRGALLVKGSGNSQTSCWWG